MDKIKLTPDVTITVAIAPNGIKTKGRFYVGINSCSMTDNVDYFEIGWTQSCYDKIIEDSPGIPKFHGVFRFEHELKADENNMAAGWIGLLSQFKNTKQLIMEFMIHSLRIKYKNNDKLWYYPS